MKPEKRSWLYSGIGAPPGLALVTAGRRPVSAAKSRFLLVGGAVARAFSVPFAKLASEYRVPFRFDYRPGCETADWVANRWMEENQDFSPSTVILDLDPSNLQAKALVDQVRGIGGSDFWIDGRMTGMYNSLTTPTMHLPLGSDKLTPTAAGYAGWAVAVWRAISRSR